MKKIFFILILFLTILYIPQKTHPVFYGEDNLIEEFSNDEKCLRAVRRISSAFQEVNTVSVLIKKNSCLCGITTDNKISISEEKVKVILYDIFPQIENIKLEINNKRADDIMELSYLSSGPVKQKYISLRFDFLISED